MTSLGLDRLELASPLLLLAAPVLLAVLFLARGRGRRVVGWSSAGLFGQVPATWRVRIAWLPAACVAGGILAGSLALARPRLGDERTVVQSEGIAIELVVDTSGSMWAHDFEGPDGEPTDRLSAVKRVVRAFVEGGDGLPGRGGDLVGLTVFAGYADAACPLTLDHRLLLDALDAAQIARTRFEDGTSIAQGLAVALGRLRESKAKSRVVVLLTDGVHNDPDSDPMQVASIAKELGVRVYTIGMGTTGLAPFPEETEDGRVVMRSIPVQLDERLLQAIAEETGGVYQRAGNTQSLRAIYSEIDRLERVDVEGVTYRRWRELFPYPAGAAAALWALALLLETTLLRRAG